MLKLCVLHESVTEPDILLYSVAFCCIAVGTVI